MSAVLGDPRFRVDVIGFEPTTYCLQGSCLTIRPHTQAQFLIPDHAFVRRVQPLGSLPGTPVAAGTAMYDRPTAAAMTRT